MPPFRTHSAYAFFALGASISFAFCKATTTAGTRMSCTTMPGIAFKSAPEMNAANVNAPASAAIPLRITFTMPQTILPATMAVKSHLRGERPVVLAVSTNDGLSGSAANLGTLLNRRHYYFVPLRQDAPHSKPRSLVADMTLIPAAIDAAMNGRQLQPILLAPIV